MFKTRQADESCRGAAAPIIEAVWGEEYKLLSFNHGAHATKRPAVPTHWTRDAINPMLEAKHQPNKQSVQNTGVRTQLSSRGRQDLQGSRAGKRGQRGKGLDHLGLRIHEVRTYT